VQPFDPALYGDRIADVYDDWYGDATDVEGTVATVVALAAGGPVLELGVGTGRVAIPLVEAGLEVHGVDASRAMVDRLLAKPRGGEVRVTVGDFGDLPPTVGDGFAVVLLPFNALFNLPSEMAQRRCLARCAEVLRPGGHVVVEAAVPGDEPVDDGVAVRQVSPDRVLLSAFRREGDVVTGSLVSIAESGIRLHPWQIRPVAPDALDAMAADAGLAAVRRHGGWRHEPFDDRSDRHVTVYAAAGGYVRR
jgi:SAM-dependent methyltransferase